MHNIVKLLCVTAAFMLGLTTAQGQNAPLKLTLFGQPSVNNDAIWMAFEKGLYQEEGLDVTYRLFPSGTTAFQAFQTGQGDIVMTGDLPSVQYFFRVKGDYRTIAVIERDARLRRRRRQGHQDAARPAGNALGRPACGSFRNIYQE
jgi:ABC-type nitrate/sulfonate/bicarbonate transport system substrate-binding protein